MSINRTTCPSCGAGLKSATGFNPGQALRCPKCSTPLTVPAFEVEEDDADAPPPKKKGPPARAARGDDDDDRPRRRRPRDDDDDDDADDRPRKKKKTKYQEYKTSPVRFAVLGVLLVVLGVLAFLLYQKKMKEKEDNAEGPEPAAPVAAGPGGNLGPAPNAPPRANPRQDLNPGVNPGVNPGGIVVEGPAGGPKAAAAAERGMNGLKQVMLAMHNHHDVTTAFPPAAVTARDGKAVLSWRVKLLPYLEEDELYKQFKLNEPWDSPTNRPLVAKMPAVFQGTLPANDGKTAFKVFVGGGALFDLRQGRQIRNVTDGTSNTLAVVESGPPVEWTRPEDIPFDGKTAPRLVSPTGGDIILAARADGAVGRLSLVRNPADVIVKGITAAGGEVVQFQFERNR